MDSRNQNNFKCVSFDISKRSSAKYANRITRFQVKLGSNNDLKHILLKEGYLPIYGQYYNHIDIRLLLTVLDKGIAFTKLFSPCKSRVTNDLFSIKIHSSFLNALLLPRAILLLCSVLF